LGWQSPTQLCLFKTARRRLRAAGGAAAVCGAVPLAAKNVQLMIEGEVL